MSHSFSSTMPEPFIIAPENEQTVNHHAFKDEEELYLGLFPKDIIHRLKDDSNVETRKLALSDIHQSIKNCQESDILPINLQKIVILVTMPLSDNNIKILLMGLQVLHELINKLQKRILPHVDQILTTYLERIASNKYNVKQTGMKLLISLTSVAGPMKVADMIMKHGLSSRRSKVREETLNIITIILLHFPDFEFNLISMVANITPLLADSKQNVRQSCLEACMVLSKRLGKDKLQVLVSAVSSIDQSIKREPSQPSLMQAFEARLSRNLSPSINSDGLIDHVVCVANGRSNESITGADVDWILAGAGKSSSPGAGGRKISMSGSGPLRSAGKKMPWDSKDKPSSKPQPQHTMSYSTIHHQQQQHSYSSRTSGTANSTIFTSPSKPKGSYLELYAKRSVMLLSSDATQFNNHRMVNTSSGSGGASTSSMMRENYHKKVTLSNGLGEVTEDTDIFATTWPRANGYYNSFMKTTGRQISADTMVSQGPIQSSQSSKSNSTLPAIGRPPSKPLVVRGLFPPLPPDDSMLPPPLTLPTTSNIIPSSSTSSSLQIESNFLGDDDREYYNIPIDDSLLNSSLSSSVSSLCAAKDLQSATNSKKDANGVHSKPSGGKAEVHSSSHSPTTSPLATPPLMIPGPGSCSPQKGSTNNSKPNTVSAPVVPKTSNQTPSTSGSGGVIPKKQILTSPSRLSNEYTTSYHVHHQILTTNNDPVTTAVTTETVLNRTFTISPPDKGPNKVTKSSQNVITKPKSKVNSYAEASAMRKDTKLLSSPQRDLLPGKPPTTTLHNKQNGSTYVSDMEDHMSALPPSISLTPNPPILRKPKKQSPRKNVITPLKVNRQNLSPINSGACSSAPVYRVAPDSSFSSCDQDDSLVELEPHPYPDQAIRELLEDLDSGSEEWERKCNGLLTIRRLAAYHKEILIAQLQQIILVVTQEVRNLRSQVSRGAIACFGDMFAFLGRDMEQSLDLIGKTLLQVGSKSNAFFREDVEKAILEMIKATSPNKCISSLLAGGMGSGSNTIRRLLSQCLYTMVEHHGPDVMLKHLAVEKYLNAIVTLLADADVGSRYHAKRCLNELYCHPEFEHIASKVLSRPQFIKAKEMAEILRIKGVGKPPPELISAKMTRQSVNGGHFSNRSVTAPSTGPSPPTKQDYTPKPQRKRRVSAMDLNKSATNQPPVIVEVPLPDGLLVKMAANDWNERNQAISELEAFIMAHPNGLGSNIVKVFDVFNQRLTDQNSKVNLHALESFQQFVPLIGPQIHPVLSTLMEALVRTVASRYPTIHSAAINAMETLIGSVDHSLLLTPLSSAAQNGNTRVQPFMLRKLSDILPGVKPAIVQRVGLPVLWKVLSSRSPATGEARAAIQVLCESLLTCLGPEKLEICMAQQPPDQQQKLRDILRNIRS